jgi:hypothetical protein
VEILLVNRNPIVSRLFTAMNHDAKMAIREIDSIEALKMHENYAMIFIDEGACQSSFEKIQDHYSDTKKVCISYELESVEGFDATLQKPFLPLQILEVIESLEQESTPTTSYGVLDGSEIEKIKGILQMQSTQEAKGVESPSKESSKKRKKGKKDLSIELKGLSKKRLKKLLKGKEITIRIQLK